MNGAGVVRARIGREPGESSANGPCGTAEAGPSGDIGDVPVATDRVGDDAM